MSDTEKIEAGMAQMDFEVVDSGQLELPTSTPATYDFEESATYNPDAFEAEIDDYGFSIMGVDTKQKDSGGFFYYADVVTDHYKKVHVKIWQERANLYPKGDLPDTYETSRIIHAIEAAFEADLQHKNDD